MSSANNSSTPGSFFSKFKRQLNKFGQNKIATLVLLVTIAAGLGLATFNVIKNFDSAKASEIAPTSGLGAFKYGECPYGSDCETVKVITQPDLDNIGDGTAEDPFSSFFCGTNGVATAGSTTTCVGQLKPGWSIPADLKFGVNTAPGGTCTPANQAGAAITCTSVPVTGTVGNDQPVKSQIGTGTPVDTAELVDVVAGNKVITQPDLDNIGDGTAEDPFSSFFCGTNGVAVAGKTTTCVGQLKPGWSIPADLKFGVNTAPGGTCTPANQAGAAITCTSVPVTGTVGNDQPVKSQIGTGTPVDTAELVDVIEQFTLTPPVNPNPGSSNQNPITGTIGEPLVIPGLGGNYEGPATFNGGANCQIPGTIVDGVFRSTGMIPAGCPTGTVQNGQLIPTGDGAPDPINIPYIFTPAGQDTADIPTSGPGSTAENPVILVRNAPFEIPISGNYNGPAQVWLPGVATPIPGTVANGKFTPTNNTPVPVGTTLGTGNAIVQPIGSTSTGAFDVPVLVLPEGFTGNTGILLIPEAKLTWTPPRSNPNEDGVAPVSVRVDGLEGYTAGTCQIRARISMAAQRGTTDWMDITDATKQGQCSGTLPLAFQQAHPYIYAYDFEFKMVGADGQEWGAYHGYAFKVGAIVNIEMGGEIIE